MYTLHSGVLWHARPSSAEAMVLDHVFAPFSWVLLPLLPTVVYPYGGSFWGFGPGPCALVDRPDSSHGREEG